MTDSRNAEMVASRLRGTVTVRLHKVTRSAFWDGEGLSAHR